MGPSHDNEILRAANEALVNKVWHLTQQLTEAQGEVRLLNKVIDAAGFEVLVMGEYGPKLFAKRKWLPPDGGRSHG